MSRQKNKIIFRKHYVYLILGISIIVPTLLLVLTINRVNYYGAAAGVTFIFLLIFLPFLLLFFGFNTSVYSDKIVRKSLIHSDTIDKNKLFGVYLIKAYDTKARNKNTKIRKWIIFVKKNKMYPNDIATDENLIEWLFLNDYYHVFKIRLYNEEKAIQKIEMLGYKVTTLSKIFN